jgi:dihydropteroate synthase
MLDIGGESTRPGATSVSTQEEISRTQPVIRMLHEKYPELPLSIDTSKPEVAEKAINSGATLINDVAGERMDAQMFRLAASTGARLVLMHNATGDGNVKVSAVIGGEYEAPSYGDVVEEVKNGLHALAQRALAAGVDKNKIILDPGIGFGKTAEQNLRLIAQLEKIKGLGFPVLLGASRKSFIGRVLDVSPEERVEGTAASIAVGTLHGADILRVHDVRVMARVVKMVCALQEQLAK